MGWYEIPLEATDDQQFNISLEVNGGSVYLNMHLRYNTEGDFWHMDISKPDNGEMLISNVPMLTGEYPSADLLSQFQHLGIGSAIIVKATDDIKEDYPNFDQLGTDFVLFWGSGDVEDDAV